jgi:hypothetical protein
MTIMAPPSRISSRPAISPAVWVKDDGGLPPSDRAVISRKRSNFSTRKPNAMTTIVVRTQARNVLSFAA